MSGIISESYVLLFMNVPLCVFHSLRGNLLFSAVSTFSVCSTFLFLLSSNHRDEDDGLPSTTGEPFIILSHLRDLTEERLRRYPE